MDAGSTEVGKPQTRLEELIDTYYEPVLRLMTRLSGSVSSGEDLAQETFTGLAQSWRPLPTGHENRAYVYRAAYNAYRRWFRKRKLVLLPSEDPDKACTQDHSALEGLCTREDLDRLREAFQDLPPNHREVLVLIVLEGMRYGEAAEVMGVSLDTVSTWRTRAVNRLRAMLGVKRRTLEQGM